MKRKLFILLILLFLTGCTGEVHILIDTKKNMKEDTKITVLKDFLNTYDKKEDIKSYYKNVLDTYSKDYKLDVIYEKDNVVGKVKTQNKDLKVTGLETIVLKKIEEENGMYTFTLNPELKNFFETDLEIDVDKEGLLDKLVISIQSFYDIEGANSDYQNTNTNTYTWVITKNNLNEDINFTLTNKKRYDIIIPYVLKTYIWQIILGVILLSFFVFAFIIYKKAQKENEL